MRQLNKKRLAGASSVAIEGVGRKVNNMRTSNSIILFLAIVMGGIAAFLARNWLESHARASTVGASVGTIVVAAQPLGFGVALNPDNVAEIPWELWPSEPGKGWGSNLGNLRDRESAELGRG